MWIPLCVLSAALIGIEVFAIIPQERYGGDGVLLNKRLYYFGGRISNKEGETNTLQDLSYLDISKSFNVADAQSEWQTVLVDGSLTPEVNFAYCMGVDPEESSIMIYGGLGDNTGRSLPTYPVTSFNAISGTWSVLQRPPGNIQQYVSATCSRADNHKVYVFGGGSYPLGENAEFPREMFVYDFLTSAWSNSTAVPLDPGMGIRYRAASTLIGKDIYYIGGMTAHYNQTGISERKILVPMTDILIFHIESSTWEFKNATGPDIPAPRISHSIAAKPNSQDIILYGGKAEVESRNPIIEYCYVLDTTSMSWTRKDPSGQGTGPIYGQTAVFPEDSNLLFILFGSNSTGYVLNSFSVLDTETWTWKERYTSTYPGGNDGSGSYSSDSNNDGNVRSSGAIAGVVVGCVAGVALLAALFFFIRKRRNRNAKKEKIADGEANDTMIKNETPAASGGGHFKPEDTKHDIPNVTLSPLIPPESAPAYRGHIPNEIDPPMALSVQNTNNAQTAPRPQNLRPVKPDGE